MSHEGIPNKTEGEIIEELRQIMLAKMKSLPDEEFDGYGNRIVQFAEEIQTRFPEARNSQLYHLLIGSSSRPELFDVGDGEIERFIREEL